ncbi:MAG: histidine--tRNA ligase [Armatimonadetes bacterium]|nr:histidine--tRNA ligase [Armatimonadota bacterium]
MRYQAPRGTHDVLPGDADPQQRPDERLFRSHKWQWLEGVFRDVCARFGVEEIRTPIFEATGLFRRSVGEETDIVSKEMYEFEDRGGEDLTLRPEGTAGVMRAIVEHGLMGGEGQLLKVCYTGPIFRYERAQRGRYRQHHQVGIEYLGGDGPQVDVEVIALGLTYLRELGLGDVELQINSVGTPASRPVHREALRDYLRPHLDGLSEDSRRRFDTNPLRVLDSKAPQDQAVIEGAPAMLDYLEPDAKAHFEAVCAGLEDIGIPFTVNRRLVRGLDYYQKTAFEVVHGALGSQNVVLGGGRYDGLVESLGGPAVPGVGFGSGIERALLVLEQLERPGGERRVPVAYLVARSDSERRYAQRLAAELRAGGVAVEMDLLGRSMKAQMRAANSCGAAYAVFVRDDLLEAGQVAVKCLEDGVQVQVQAAELAASLNGEMPG